MSRAVWIGLGVWYGVWSLLGFGLMGYDKWAARHRPRARIRERTLLTAAFLGGGPLMCVAMRLFHHKTRHWYFTAINTAALLAWAALLAYRNGVFS